MKYTWFTLLFLALIAFVAIPLHAYRLKRPWKLFDLTFFGVAFVFSAFAELANIVSTDWKYHPKFFGIQTSGFAAIVILAAQPLLHAALGYGFLTLRRWTLFLAVFYTADVLTSTILAFITEGYGKIRMIFLIMLPVSLIYIFARRNYFVK